MEIKFIGTGSGKTSLKRFHSSLLIYSDNFNLLIDAGDGISKALLLQNILFNSIDGILFSHLHPDHFSGIAALLVQMKLVNRKNELKILAHTSLIPVIKNFIFSSYLFEERMDFKITYCGFDNKKGIRLSDGIEFMAEQNTHLDPYLKYDEENKLSFSCSSFLFKLNNENVFYTGDVGNSKDLLLFNEHPVSIMIAECTHIKTGDLESAHRIPGLKKIILTHIPDEAEQQLISWKNSLSDEISDYFYIASDGMTIQIE